MSARKSVGPKNSLGRPWVEGEAWRCARCGKNGPDRDDVALGLCLPREVAHPSLAYHELDFEPASHAEAMAAKRARRRACPSYEGCRGTGGESDLTDSGSGAQVYCACPAGKALQAHDRAGAPS